MEQNYLDLIRKVLEKGEERNDRTGTGTISLFAEKLEYDISEFFPLLTTKKVPFKMIAKELLWFLQGDTNSKNLEKQGVKIWVGNSTRQFLDSRNLPFDEGDIGALYGFQWRHFGENYTGYQNEYKGFDQISEVIRLIKEEPESRRILFSAWNPDQFHNMSIYPCHVMAQFYVRNGEFLDCQMYQRSGDLLLGVPFNIASYSLLTYMIASVTNLKPGKFTHVFGDVHIYQNHIEGAKIQIERTGFIFPTLQIKKRENIFDYTLEDFEINNYISHPSIKFKMAV